MADRAQEGLASAFRVRMPQRFTSDGAFALQHLARRLPPGSLLDLDLTDVREFQEAAMLALARIVMASRVRCAFRGLTQQQARLLEYLGATIAQPPAPLFDVD